MKEEKSRGIFIIRHYKSDPADLLGLIPLTINALQI